MKKSHYLLSALLGICLIFAHNSSWAQSDDCASAVSLSPTFGSCSTTSYSIPSSFTRDAVAEASCVADANNAKDGWFSFVANGTSTTIDIDVTQSNRNVALAIYSGTCGSLVEQGCVNAAGNGNPETITFTTTPLATYLIRVIRRTGSGTATNNMSGNICVYSPIPNDECAGAIDLPVGQFECSFTAGTNVGSTHSSVTDASCASSAGAEDVWYRFTAPAGGQVAIDMQAGSMTDSGLALYSGTCGSLTEIECDDDDGSGSMSRIVRYDLTPGATYYLRVWDFGGGTGTFDICLQNQYSDCDVSLPLCSSTSFNTNSFGEGLTDSDIGNCFSGGVDATEIQSIWINFEIQTDGDLSFIIDSQNPGGDDYDFVLWRADNASFCSDVDVNGTVMSCNASSDTGTGGTTGVSSPDYTSWGGGENNPDPNAENPGGGNPFNASITGVTAGERYYLIVNNFSNTGIGFDLNFTGSTAGLDCTILPLELTEFRGEKVQEDNLLHWATVNEFNTSHFEIERSNDAMDFVQIGTLSNSKSKLEQQIYQFWDHEPQNGINYYRLKQIDNDGSFTYSRTIALDNTGEIAKFELQKIYPNPTQNQLNYVVAMPTTSEVTIEVFDSRGERITTLSQQLCKGVHTIPHNTSMLAKGLYIVKITDNKTGKILIEKFVKE